MVLDNFIVSPSDCLAWRLLFFCNLYVRGNLKIIRFKLRSHEQIFYDKAGLLQKILLVQIKTCGKVSLPNAYANAHEQSDLTIGSAQNDWNNLDGPWNPNQKYFILGNILASSNLTDESNRNVSKNNENWLLALAFLSQYTIYFRPWGANWPPTRHHAGDFCTVFYKV